jgi:hypothetical protein
VAPEGVVNALRNIHEALVTGGLLIDTQPVSRRPRVEASSSELGRLDMSEWAGTIAQIDRLTEQTVRAGLFRLIREDRFTVTDQFPTGAELVAEVREWAGTQVDPTLAQRISRERRPVQVQQEVRLRVFQACQP